MKNGIINCRQLEVEHDKDTLIAGHKVKVVALVEDKECNDGEGYLVLYKDCLGSLKPLILDKDLVDLEEELTKISFD